MKKEPIKLKKRLTYYLKYRNEYVRDHETVYVNKKGGSIEYRFYTTKDPNKAIQFNLYAIRHLFNTGYLTYDMMKSLSIVKAWEHVHIPITTKNVSIYDRFASEILAKNIGQ